MNESNRRWALFGGLGVSLVLLFGLRFLGGETVEPMGRVSGTVAFQGEPVSEGIVIFQNTAQGVYMTDELDEQGRFEIIMAQGAGLPLGDYEVSISPPLPKTPPLGDIPGAPPTADEYPHIPRKYRDPKTSGITLKVEPGDNRLEIDMRR